MTGTEVDAGPDTRTGGRWRAAYVAPLIVGVLGVVVAAFGTWRPSFWYDEAATVSATDRSLRQMLGLVEHTDLVHAAYYFSLHLWTSAFGFSEFSIRFPSAIAVGAAGAAMVVLGERLCDRQFGIVAGVLLVAMPRTMWAGSEARSYAGTLFLAVLLTLVLLIAADRGRWWWVGYAVVGIVTTAWFFLSITVVCAHVAILLTLRRRLSRGFLAAVTGIVVGVLPFAWAAFRQRDQVSWISPITVDSLRSFARYEIPDGSLTYLVVALTVLAGGALTAAILDRRGEPGARWRVLLVGLWWWMLPSVVVLAYSWLITPTYTPRYLIFAAPGVAVMLAWSVMQLARDRAWMLVLLTGLLAAVTVPHYLGQRAPYGRFGGTDFSQVADYIGARAQPGDCVAFAGQPSWSPVSTRVIRSAKPDDFRRVRDIGPREAAPPADLLWDLDRPVTAYRGWARTCSVVWVVADGERDRASSLLPGGTTYWRFDPNHFTATPLYAQLSADGLHIVDRASFNHSQVVQMRR